MTDLVTQRQNKNPTLNSCVGGGGGEGGNYLYMCGAISPPPPFSALPGIR